MFKVKVLFFTLFFFSTAFSLENLYGLTLEEATRYGSRIIICYNNLGEEIYLRYWKLIVKSQAGGERNRQRANTPSESRSNNAGLKEYVIFDMQKKRNYDMDSCKLYYCSPRPDRMLGCIMPEDKKRSRDITK